MNSGFYICHKIIDQKRNLFGKIKKTNAMCNNDHWNTFCIAVHETCIACLIAFWKRSGLVVPAIQAGRCKD